MSYHSLLYHIIFRSKNNKRVFDLNQSVELYKYITGVVKNKNCILHRINGTEDHIHILVQLHPTIAISSFVKELKTITNNWIHSTSLFPNFESWSKEYAAFSCSYYDRETIIQYIKNQREHHSTISFQDELKNLLLSMGISYDEKYFLID